MRKSIVVVVAGLSLVACKREREKGAEQAEAARDKMEAQQPREAPEQQATGDQYEQPAPQAQAEPKAAPMGESAAPSQMDQQGEAAAPSQMDQQQQAQMEPKSDEEAAAAGGQMGMTSSMTGTVKETPTGEMLILKNEAGSEIALKTDENTIVTFAGNKVDIEDYESGTEVRAAFREVGNDKLAVDVEILKPVKK